MKRVEAATDQSGLNVTLEEVSLPQLSQEEREQLHSCLQEYADLFARGDSDLGATDLVKHAIDTGDHPPIKQPPRRALFALWRHMNEMTRKMEEQGIIQPSKSPWASPIVLVTKKDGSTCFCVDYRKLNAVTKMDGLPPLRIDDTLDMLSGQRFFTTLDLASGYWQVRLADDAKEKTELPHMPNCMSSRLCPLGYVMRQLRSRG